MTDLPVFIAGHSLGAADAFLYAYSRVRRGLRVDGVFAFASPRPGDHVIGSVLKTRVPCVRSVKNDFDGVTFVPLDAHADNCGWSYEDVVTFEDIQETPPFADFLADPFFAHHHISLYQIGTHKLPPGNASIKIGQAADSVARLYETAAGWDWINPTDGLYWAMTTINGARLMIRRGSKTGRDWFTEDFDFEQIDLHGARVSRGFWAGVAPVESALDAQLT